MFIISFVHRLGNTIQRGTPLGALVVVDLIQEAGAIVAAAAEVSARARARGLMSTILVCLGVIIICQLSNCDAASLQRAKLCAGHLLKNSQGLLLDLALALVLVRGLGLCQGMYVLTRFLCF